MDDQVFVSVECAVIQLAGRHDGSYSARGIDSGGKISLNEA
jgi:hypothetical protein